MYAVYDMKDKEMCIGIYETAKDIAERLNVSESGVYSAIFRNNEIKKQYKIERIEEDV